VVLDSSFGQLRQRLEGLREALDDLSVAAEECRPTGDDSALIDVLTDATLVSRGWIEEALGAARQGQQALQRPNEVEAARRALAFGQERYSRVAHRLLSDLMSYERVDMVTRLGRERGGEWSAWSKGVRSALDRCRQPLLDVDQALFACAQAIAGPTNGATITLQAIGQQFAGGQPTEEVTHGSHRTA
jgi:hypothetical protein